MPGTSLELATEDYREMLQLSKVTYDPSYIHDNPSDSLNDILEEEKVKTLE